MTPIRLRLSDLPLHIREQIKPTRRKRVKVDKVSTTQPAQEHTYTPQQDELRRVRLHLSMLAARVGMKGVPLSRVIEAVEAELDTLRRLHRE